MWPSSDPSSLGAGGVRGTGELTCHYAAVQANHEGGTMVQGQRGVDHIVAAEPAGLAEAGCKPDAVVIDGRSLWETCGRMDRRHTSATTGLGDRSS